MSPPDASTEVGSSSTATDPGRRLSAMLEALGDEANRAILQVLGEAETPLTAGEVAGCCDISLTSIYRKLDQLTAAGLVVEQAELDPDGHRRSRYRPAAGQIEILLGTNDGVEVTLYHTATTHRLASG